MGSPPNVARADSPAGSRLATIVAFPSEMTTSSRIG
jgi:hypothetical protein